MSAFLSHAGRAANPVEGIEVHISVSLRPCGYLDLASSFCGRYGPAAVHRDEPTFDGSAYWRGPAWPQLTYLLWVAARQHDDAATAEGLAARLIAGATQSGHAEYWDPDTGQGLGAPLQSWTALAAVVSEQIS